MLKECGRRSEITNDTLRKLGKQQQLEPERNSDNKYESYAPTLKLTLRPNAVGHIALDRNVKT